MKKFLDSIKKNIKHILFFLIYLILYVSSFVALYHNFKGMDVLEANIFNDASFIQVVISLLYVFWIFLSYYKGKKENHILYLRFSLINGYIMVLIPLFCLASMLFGVETELVFMLVCYLLLITLSPLSGFGITYLVPFVIFIPIIGLVLIILSKKEIKKSN